jgi:predicted nucleic acid-binding protein
MKAASGQRVVPATERSFTADFPPAHLYLDTDFLHACMTPTEPHYTRSAAFVEWLITHAITTIYVSPLTWMEFAFNVMKEQFRSSLPPKEQLRFNLANWQRQTVRETYLMSMIKWLESFLSHFNWAEIPLTDTVRMQAVEYMAVYNLKPHDAMHVAAANSVGVADLASFDKKYRRINGLFLWNDRIYEIQPA